jgi:hypothetical protein
MNIKPHQWIAVFINHHDWWSFVGNNKTAFGAVSASNPCVAEITEYWQNEYEPCYGRSVPAKEKCACLIDEWRYQLRREYPEKINEWDMKYNCQPAIDIITATLVDGLLSGKYKTYNNLANPGATAGLTNGSLCTVGGPIDSPYVYYTADLGNAWHWQDCRGYYESAVQSGAVPIPDTSAGTFPTPVQPELYNVWFMPTEVASAPFYTYTP